METTSKSALRRFSDYLIQKRIIRVWSDTWVEDGFVYRRCVNHGDVQRYVQDAMGSYWETLDPEEAPAR